MVYNKSPVQPVMNVDEHVDDDMSVCICNMRGTHAYACRNTSEHVQFVLSEEVQEAAEDVVGKVIGMYRFRNLNMEYGLYRFICSCSPLAADMILVRHVYWPQSVRWLRSLLQRDRW